MPKRLDPQEGAPLGGEGLDPSPLPMLCACRQHAGNQHCPSLSFSPPAKVRVQGRSTWLDEDQARGGRWGGGLWRLWRGCERMGPIVAPQQVLGNGLEFLRRNELLGSSRLHPERIFSFPASHGGPVAHPAHRATVHQRVDTNRFSQFDATRLGKKILLMMVKSTRPKS